MLLTPIWLLGESVWPEVAPTCWGQVAVQGVGLCRRREAPDKQAW